MNQDINAPSAGTTGDVIRVDQDECETVIPRVGGQVLIVNGRGRGHTAVVRAIHEDKYCCDVAILKEFAKTCGPEGLLLTRVEYEDVSKLATSAK